MFLLSPAGMCRYKHHVYKHQTIQKRGGYILARTTKTTQQSNSTRPFLTPEGEANHLISLAYNLAEQRLIDGTASSQEVTHFLKEGSRKAVLEREKLEEENKLLRAKTESLQSQKRVEELYMEALNAMRKYSGQSEIGEEDGEY